ncbi:hypothetical protein EAX61_00175 [Dokdonia sinensis]|uniref:YbjN domain-containing protein n=1 Tax=Dokdonia sinensis TaxID=2479847 RepID=A0A3M0GQ67_9FLAO|nr:hypothetical protein [Dokdonia sinensis]RMB63843.1 hypothetical protein EAX61_00175 [Dokdonia sinensis]
MKAILLPLLLFIGCAASAQMNNETLKNILEKEVDTLSGTSGRWQLLYNDLPMIVLTDETNDRMRIIAPITEASTLDKGLLLDCLTANFHSALDVKYALSDDILWSVFVHPLSPLTEGEVQSAVQQVYAAAVTFGTTFSSTPLLFGGNQTEDKPVNDEDIPTVILKKT